MDQSLTGETASYVGLCRLESAYADTVNRRSWEELGELFLPSATVEVDTVTAPVINLTGPQELGDFISSSISRFEFFEFVVLNTHVETAVQGDPDAARARVFMCELRQDGATGHWSNTFGVYHDTCRRIGDRWWFSRRRYRSLARTGRSEVFEFRDLMRSD